MQRPGLSRPPNRYHIRGDNSVGPIPVATRYPERNPFHAPDWSNSLPHLDRTVRAWCSAICAPLGQVSKLAPDLCPLTHISAVCTISSTVDPCPYFPYIKSPSSSPSPCSCPWFRRRTACVPASSQRCGAVLFSSPLEQFCCSAVAFARRQ